MTEHQSIQASISEPAPCSAWSVDALASLLSVWSEDHPVTKVREAMTEAASRLRAVEAEKAELKKDAARWRFAAKYGVDMAYTDTCYVFRGPAGGECYESIDAAMAAAVVPSDERPNGN